MDRQTLLVGNLTEDITPGLVAIVLCPGGIVPCLTCYPASALNVSLVAQTWGSLL